MHFKEKGIKSEHGIVRCSTNEKIKRIQHFKNRLIECGVTSYKCKFSRNEFIQEIRRQDASEGNKFVHQDLSTIGKWINLAIGLAPKEMMEAEELMISYSTIAKRSGLVWEVVEKARFGSLDGQKKVMCLRATVSKHLYRLELAPKVREFITTGLRDYSLPLNSGEGDLHTKWIGSESQAIIQHCDYIANEVRKFLFEKKISPCIMTKGDISLGQWKTCHGVAGLLAHLYKDVPGPKSNRVAHHQPSTHLRKIIETLQNQFPSPCSKDGDLLLEEQSTDSAKICSDTNVEAANIRKRNRNVSMKSMTDGIRKTGTNRRRNVKKKNHCKSANKRSKG